MSDPTVRSLRHVPPWRGFYPPHSTDDPIVPDPAALDKRAAGALACGTTERLLLPAVLLILPEAAARTLFYCV